MALFAVVNEAGLKAWLDSGHNTLVDVAFTLLTTRGFNVEVDKLLTINNGNTQLLGVRGVK